MANSSLLSGLTLLLVISSICSVEGLQSGFYARTCRRAESTIAKLVRDAVRNDRRVGAGLIRLSFHDCFVQGCDASVLIDDGSGTREKDAVPNSFFTNFDLIDQIKTAVEKLCVKTVSCADIIAFAAKTSISALGGPVIDVQGGRFDGLVSSSSDVVANIPSPFSSIATLESSFSGKGLSSTDLVLLSGAHTVGKGHCGAFTNRLRNFSANNSVDPSLDPTLAASLAATCPVNFASTTVVDMDTLTPTFWDNRYFKLVQTKKGLFTSDAQLYATGSDTKSIVDQFARSNSAFSRQFSTSFKKMMAIGVKTSANGNIRTNCRSFT